MSVQLAGMTCYFGFPGSGKSTIIAHDSIMLLNKGYKVYTSGILVKGVPEFDLSLVDKDIYPAYGSVLFIDESGLDLNNQHVLSDRQRQFYKLARHAEITIIYFSQSHEDTNIVLRRLTVRYFYVRKFFGLSICYPILTKLCTRPYVPNAGLFDPNRGYGELLVGFKVGGLLSKGSRIIRRSVSYQFFDTHTLPNGIKLLDYNRGDTF